MCVYVRVCVCVCARACDVARSGQQATSCLISTLVAQTLLRWRGGGVSTHEGICEKMESRGDGERVNWKKFSEEKC